MKHFTWDGTESGLENLLIWWGTVEPFVHSENCEGQEITLHCCEGEPSHIGNASIGMEARSTRHDEALPIYFEFLAGKRAGTRYDMHPGDTIFYEDGKFSFKESFECVVISQDWP